MYSDCVLMLLLTEQRKFCVLSMRWDEINTVNQTWIIPTSKIKSKKPHVVSLSIESMKILNRRSKNAQSGDEFVFPNRRSHSGHIAEKSGEGSFWRRIIKKMGKSRKLSSRNG
ncbi:tyrosine-type recombinase/integrase [Vibrio sp. F74]|uniref:tyrosine-type recombinase/integrase n=1 Tax=Vibrio sp. F74 TaxID=700020 RepID=UPI0035F573A3